MADADRIERAAAELRKKIPYLAAPSHEYVARIALEAADREPPKWPTDATLDKLDEVIGVPRDILREAMLLDPIIRAAIAYRNAYASTVMSSGKPQQVLLDAVNEAGL